MLVVAAIVPWFPLRRSDAVLGALWTAARFQ
jgi:hypothetical protein